MTIYLLDTSAVVEILNGTEKGNNIIEIIDENATATTAITVYEIYIGAKLDALKKILDFFDNIKIVPLDSNTALKSAIIEKELKANGKMINKIDILIAGICRYRNLMLITLDKDFENIKSIKTKIIN